MQFVSPTSPEHWQAIAVLAAEIWREHYTPIIGAEQVEYMLKHFQSVEAMKAQQGEGYRYFMVLSGGRLVGYLSFREEEQALFLSKIYLQASLRGKGYGRRMMQFVIAQARQRQKTRIRLTVNKYNKDAIQAYLRMGFSKEKALVIDIGGGFVMDDYEMVLSIAEA